MDNHFELLSTGGYAYVYYHKERQLIRKVQQCTVKVDDKDPNSRIIQYSAIVDLVSHASLDIIPGLPVMLDYSITSKNVNIYMPYYGKPLHKIVTIWNNEKCHKDRELAILHILANLIDTCVQLEHNGIQHTDIKPSNVLVNDFHQVTLIDFNIMSSLRCHKNKLKWESSIGTWSYCAPEIVSKSMPTNTSVVWSLGLLLAYMFGTFPLIERHGMTDANAMNRQVWVELFKNEYDRNSEHLSLPNKHKLIMPSSLQYIYSRCTQWNPDDRLSLFELRSIIHLYRTGQIPPPLYLHTVSWIADPMHLPTDMREQAIEILYKLCVGTDTERIFVQMVSWLDRLPYNEVNAMDVAALFCLGLMLLGNYVFDDPEFYVVLFAKLDIPNDKNILMEHIVTIGQALQWRLWEKTADVSLCEMGKKHAISCIKDVLLNIKTKYTMADLAMSTI